ncbi:MAG: hypothetical protein KDD02_14785 [Phaeodactylibacter sp.]|nr:hypothetical protein [Phaeodactylibacter sp.]MCB2092401.1 hypothetical protein [Alphaproteobacteria bacterium]
MFVHFRTHLIEKQEMYGFSYSQIFKLTLIAIFLQCTLGACVLKKPEKSGTGKLERNSSNETVMEDSIRLKTDKWYRSTPIEWEDFHAGHTSGLIFNYLKFRPDFKFAFFGTSDPNLDVDEFLSKRSEEELIKDTSVAYGDYEIADEKKIYLNYEVINKKVRHEFEILASDTLLHIGGNRFYIYIGD